jgi:hypothetical protein
MYKNVGWAKLSHYLPHRHQTIPLLLLRLAPSPSLLPLQHKHPRRNRLCLPNLLRHPHRLRHRHKLPRLPIPLNSSQKVRPKLIAQPTSSSGLIPPRRLMNSRRRRPVPNALAPETAFHDEVKAYGADCHSRSSASEVRAGGEK